MTSTDDSQFVQRWLSLEKEYVNKLLRSSLASSNSWDWAYPEVLEVDTHRLVVNVQQKLLYSRATEFPCVLSKY